MTEYLYSLSLTLFRPLFMFSCDKRLSRIFLLLSFRHNHHESQGDSDSHTQATSDEDMSARDEHVLWSEPWKSRKTKLEPCLFLCFFSSCLSFLKNLSFFVDSLSLSSPSQWFFKRYLKNRKILNLWLPPFSSSSELVRYSFFIPRIHCRCRKQWVIVRHFITGNQFCLRVQQRDLFLSFSDSSLLILLPHDRRNHLLFLSHLNWLNFCVPLVSWYFLLDSLLDARPLDLLHDAPHILSLDVASRHQTLLWNHDYICRIFVFSSLTAAERKRRGRGEEEERKEKREEIET